MWKSLQTPAGLTHGRGSTESAHHLGTQYARVCATTFGFELCSEYLYLQKPITIHAECGLARMKRDTADCRRLLIG